VTHDDRHDRERRAWDAVATGWERHRDDLVQQSRSVSEWMVEHLDARAGDIVLELAAGNGETGFLAAQVVGATGRLVITDLSPAMLATARNAAAARALGNVEFRVVDLGDIPLEDRSVDGILCRWGYQQASDPRKAFREAHRVLRPRRRICLSVWADYARNPLQAAIPAALADLDPPTTPKPASYTPPVPSLETAEEVGLLLCEADFTDVLVEEVELHWHFSGDDDLWAFVSDLFGSAAMRIAALDAADRATARENLLASLAVYQLADGYVLPSLCLNAMATRPGP